MPDAFGPRINPIVPPNASPRATVADGSGGSASKVARDTTSGSDVSTASVGGSRHAIFPIIEPAKDRSRHRDRRAALDSPDDRDPQGRVELLPFTGPRDEVQDAQLAVQVCVGQRINPEAHVARCVTREARRLEGRRVRVVANVARLVRPCRVAQRLWHIHAFGAIPIGRPPALWEWIGNAWQF